ncbi:hypothetical protein PENTCL1PPCAC_4107, partial [Pristionchus entomophagus]
QSDTMPITMLHFSHDFTFLIEGKKAYANKQQLAFNSPVFKTMLFGDFAEKDQKRIALKDINHKEFTEMLLSIYPPQKPVNRISYKYLLMLADRFEIKDLIVRCEQFLMN